MEEGREKYNCHSGERAGKVGQHRHGSQMCFLEEGPLGLEGLDLDGKAL